MAIIRALPLVLLKGTFIGNQITDVNTADGGAAMYLPVNCNVVLKGKSTFLRNTAPLTGGAIWIGGRSRLNITGPLCAQGNQVGGSPFNAANPAGFIQVNRAYLAESARVTFSNIDSTFIDGNLPSDVGFDTNSQTPSESGIFCNTSPNRWQPGAYNITGLACACDSEFTSGSNATCDSCLASWDSDACACKVSGACTVALLLCQERWWHALPSAATHFMPSDHSMAHFGPCMHRNGGCPALCSGCMPAVTHNLMTVSHLPTKVSVGLFLRMSA